METRKERYAKYREQIRLTPDDQFSSSRRSTPINSQDIDLLSSVDKPSMLIFLAVPWAFAPNQSIIIPAFCVIIMIARDLVVDALRLIAVQKNKVIAANIFGKMKTFFQMVAIPAVMLNDWPFSYFDASWGAWRISLVLVYIATAMSLISGVIYVIQNRAVLKQEKQ